MIITERLFADAPVGATILVGGVMICIGDDVILHDAVNKVDVVIIEDTVRVDSGRSSVTDKEDVVSKDDTVRDDNG